MLFFLTRLRTKRHVAETFSILDAAHFKVSSSKCIIAVHQIQFLSHIITKSILRSSQNKTQTILDIHLPRTLSQVNRFLDKIGYYRKFILDFARIGAPVHKVTKKICTKRHESYWHAEQQEAFEHFKTILTTFPLFLHFPDPSVLFILSMDDSLIRIVDVLKQQISSGLKVCHYRSRVIVRHRMLLLGYWTWDTYYMLVSQRILFLYRQFFCLYWNRSWTTLQYAQKTHIS